LQESHFHAMTLQERGFPASWTGTSRPGGAVTSPGFRTDQAEWRGDGEGRRMPTPAQPLRDLLDRAVAVGILSTYHADAVVALDAQPAPGARRGAVIAEVLGYVGGALAVVAALFLGAELWDELGPWPRVLLLGAVAVACLGAGAALGGRDGAPGRLGGFLWAAAVIAVAATAGVAADDLGLAEPGTSALAAAVAALVVAAVLWWRRPAVLQHIATFLAAAATLLTALDRIGDGSFDWGGPLLWGFGLAWLAASAFPAAKHKPDDGPAGIWTPAAPGWVLGALAVVIGPLFAQSGRAGWLVVGSLGAAALVVAGVRTRNPWVAAVGIGGVFVSVPLAVAELFDARLGPLVGILAVGLALVGAAVVLTRRAAR
jgi:hypothetical protein